MKVVLFAFNGDPMCFVHVLLHALDMKAKNYEVAIVMEGSATKLIKDFHENPDMPFANLYKKVVDARLISLVCKACAAKMGSLESALNQNLPIGDDMSGHPSMTTWMEKGYTVLTF
ncbi:DsrE family protein [Myxococcota bacterium]|nr:DsrE family protein [Myxococcota bacterium]MBU1381274.1 DsrE family protein [Myxococcota bacterium]MBU1495986.1 DsrE family protein [Myxococcota bacterium]